MSTDDAKPLAAAGDAERRAFLERLFWKTADRMDSVLDADSPSGSALQAARMFLRDQGISLATLGALRRKHGGLGFDPAGLPAFDNKDETAETLPEALRNVEAFAPPKNSAE